MFTININTFTICSVLIGRNEVIKISDFGTSKTWGGERSTCMSFAGTVAWMAPEVIRNEPCNEKVDIWSFGVCLWELLNCEVPYRVSTVLHGKSYQFEVLSLLSKLMAVFFLGYRQLRHYLRSGVQFAPVTNS